MQVKKFEARSMKEALIMIKAQLGPDAIILSARDNRKSFGLVGEGSVEVTAAVSKETLQKKQFVESRIREEDRTKLIASPARNQREFMDKMVNRYTEENKPRKPISSVRYADIQDGEMYADEGSYSRPQQVERAAQASMRTTAAAPVHMTQTNARQPQTQTQASVQPVKPPQINQHDQRDAEIQSLKGEIAGLKQVLRQFQNIPQNLVGRHPGADYGLMFEVSPSFEKMNQVGIAPEIAAEILTEAQNKMEPMKLKNKALVDAFVARQILNTTTVVGDKKHARIHNFIGPAGCGKTASLVKLASHLVVNEKKKIAVLTTDTFKVGAADQLRIFAQILNVPFGIVRSDADWTSVFSQLASYDHILIDYPGLSLKNVDEIAWIKKILPAHQGGEAAVHLVISGIGKDSDSTEIGKRFKVAGYSDVIFTCLDESVQHGVIYNFIRRFQVPLHSFGIGGRIPEDYELATRERVLDLLFKLTKINKEQE